MTILIGKDVYVDVDLEPDELSDDELRQCLKEADKRGLLNAEVIEREYIELAYDEARGGRLTACLALLERALHPEPIGTTRKAFDKLQMEAHQIIQSGTVERGRP